MAPNPNPGLIKMALDFFPADVFSRNRRRRWRRYYLSMAWFYVKPLTKEPVTKYTPVMFNEKKVRKDLLVDGHSLGCPYSFWERIFKEIYLSVTLMVHKTAWRNGSAFDSRSKGCVFESRRGQQQADPFSRSISSHVSSVFCRAVTCCPTWGGEGKITPGRAAWRGRYQFHRNPLFRVEFQGFSLGQITPGNLHGGLNVSFIIAQFSK